MCPVCGLLHICVFPDSHSLKQRYNIAVYFKMVKVVSDLVIFDRLTVTV